RDHPPDRAQSACARSPDRHSAHPMTSAVLCLPPTAASDSYNQSVSQRHKYTMCAIIGGRDFTAKGSSGMPTEPATTDISTPSEDERRAVYSRCERFLGGHGPSRPHAMLAALAAATDPDEQADRYGEG